MLTKVYLLGAFLLLTCLSLCSGSCDDCAMDNGIGFTNTSDCDQYLQCEEIDSGTLRSTLIQCPNGLFWDQNSLTCNYPAYVTCANDPCSNPGVTSYNINCRQYYLCHRRDIPASCCDAGQAFNPATGQCESDGGCTVTCFPGSFTTNCPNLRPVNGNAAVYEELVFGNWIERPCPGGTSYEQSTCTCSGPPVAVATCQPLVKLDFDSSSVTDVSGNYNWVQNSGVTVSNGEGFFDGNSFLRIPRFSNTPLTPHFEIRVTYRTTTDNLSGTFALVTNNDCGKFGSVQITVDSTGSKLAMRSTTGDVHEMNAAISNPSQPHTIIYKFSDNQFTGSLDGTAIQTIANVGDIGDSECAIQIGRGDHLKNFEGYIDLIEIYDCAASFVIVQV